MDDLISRQKAIEALNDELTITGKTNAIVVQDYIRKVNVRLNDLPSTQPDWNEMMVMCDCCGHAIHVKRIDVGRREE